MAASAPEPWREPSPWRPEPQRRPRNPLNYQHETGDTELSWGEGLVPPHANGEPPSELGQYMPRAPRLDPPSYGVGRPRQHRRPRNEVRGCPGNRIAR
ncbi:hypothetical protein PT015_07725 [Candidatus Mycobacterium wuenschmannii]|uniref:Uncharacterized protein n=1 Tax=Candidatus Mycobacterium wuenschmannii TaxID=3027808 RepID=A0ABY8W1T4_9MYCO|nr:hypothetical protein [Candidatus Mycobacterium wuenschmannii]WIM89321.1 hypothetical protein PT015_07725 [Candidatus Mycobacterium wuenschmannii]